MPAISKASANAQAKLDEAEVARLKQRAARQAAAVINEAAPDLVDIRILPLGDGKVSMGVHIAGIGDAHYERGEIAKGWLRENAEALEARGFAEILPPGHDAPPPARKPKANPAATAPEAAPDAADETP